MNALFDALDAKLSALLGGGKSFFLAQSGVFPSKLCGNVFYFVSGTPVYAGRAPGLKVSGDPVPYDHDVFTDAVAAIDPGDITWDETNKVAQVPGFNSTIYTDADLPVPGFPNEYVALLDYSLEAHALLHQGSNDSEPVPYYVQEDITGDFFVPEKHYKFAVAEIVIEGPTAIVLPSNYDKYNCFRVHNLNTVAASVDFAGEYTLNLQAFECKTVRRDSVTENYREGGHYFWHFEDGDPRFYWYLPKALVSGAAGLADSAVMTNAHVANNLTNPAILLDWVKYFERDYSVGLVTIEANGWYAGWQLDPAEQADIYGFYENKFGDPSDPNTILGDLIHHKGDILIVRKSKTLTDPDTGAPLITFDTVTFNGYATIVEDFAAKQLQVAENASHNYEITSTDPDNHVYLVPISTNLLKSGDTRSTIYFVDANNGVQIENAIFEAPDYGTLSATAPQKLFHPSVSTTPDSRTSPTHGTVNGDDIVTLNWSAARGSSITLQGVHRYTVQDLLDMDFWGDPAIPGQNSTYVTRTNRELKLTPEGLVLLYTEHRSALGATKPSDGIPTVKAIQFRSHGWGYYGAAGSRDTGMVSCRVGRYRIGVPDAYNAETWGVGGEDFSVNRLRTSQDGVQILGRVKTSNLAIVGKTGRFWQCTNPGDFTSLFLHARDVYTESEFGALFHSSTTSNINNGSAPLFSGLTLPKLCMVLLPEMYNALARAINAVKSGHPLNWRTLRWEIDGEIVGLGEPGFAYEEGASRGWKYLGSWNASTNSPALASGVGTEGTYYTVSTAGSTSLDGISSWAEDDWVVFYEGAWHKASADEDLSAYDGPVPMDEFIHFMPGSQAARLCDMLGITLRDESDFPGDFATMKTRWNADSKWLITKTILNTHDASVTISNTFPNPDSPPGGTIGTASGSLQCDVQLQIAPTTPGDDYDQGIASVQRNGVQPWMNPWLKVDTTVDLKNFGHYRWVKIEDVAAAVESFGFLFSDIQLITPLSLRYFEDVAVTGSADESDTIEVPFSNMIVRFHTATVGEAEAAIEAFMNGRSHQIQDTLTMAKCKKLIRFMVTTDKEEALWKVRLSPFAVTFDVQTVHPYSTANPMSFGAGLSPVVAAIEEFIEVVVDPWGNVSNLSPAFVAPASPWGTSPHRAMIYMDPGSAGAAEALVCAPEEGIPHKQLAVLGVLHSFSSGLAAFNTPILLRSLPLWKYVTDFWSGTVTHQHGLATMVPWGPFIAVDGPWEYHARGSDTSVTAGDGLTIISAATNTRYEAVHGITFPVAALT